MEFLNSLGINVILAIQEIFKIYENIFSVINTITDPGVVTKYIFPIISIFDSVFASDLLVICSIGKWLNTILKWFIYEDRPYWWVRETNYYKDHDMKRPKIYTNFQTCETGPGNPSGHVMSTTIILTLITLWIIEIRGKGFCRRKDRSFMHKICGVFFGSILLTSMSRMFVGAHFPHQCLCGAIIGILTGHYLLNNFVTPFMELDEDFKDKPKRLYVKYLRYKIMTNICLSLVLVVIAFAVYWLMKAFGTDPVRSIKLAFKWCPSSSYLHYNSTPFYALVISTGSILGWSMCATPSIKSYRYYTRNKSYLIATLSTIMFYQIFKQWSDSVSKNDASYFYITNYAIFTLRPFFFLRVVPLLATCKNKWQASKEECRMKENKKEC